MEEKVIKPHLVKPLLEKVVFEKLQNPQNGVMVNIKPEDSIDVKKVSEEFVRATATRTLQVTPASLLKVTVSMSIDIPVDSIEFSRLPDPKDYIKNSQPVRIMLGYISNIITELTLNSTVGPIVTPPNIQEWVTLSPFRLFCLKWFLKKYFKKYFLKGLNKLKIKETLSLYAGIVHR